MQAHDHISTDSTPQSAAADIVDVLISGGGPVGLSMACELGRRGISVLVIETKHGLHEHPRSTVVSPRTMEYFRSWGMADHVFDAALPTDYPLDVAFTDHLNGVEFGRFSYPTIGDMRSASAELKAKFPALTWSRYAKTIIGQNALEPVILEHARGYENVEIRFASTVSSITQDDHSVRATVTDATGRAEIITSRFLIGSDGGRSAIRKQLGISMSGTGAVGSSVSIFFRAPDFLKAVGKTPAFLLWSFAAGATGSFIAINGDDLWVHSRHLMPDETYEDFDPTAAVQAAVGEAIDVEIISYWPWIPRELIADSYRSGRVFLAGDAAHLMSPTGGLGLNTGVGDIVNLAWKLDATLQGWAGPALLDTYTSERRAVGTRNATESTDNREKMKRTMLAARQIAEGGEQAEQARTEIERLLPAQQKHFDGNGLYLGEDYAGSPIVVDDGSAEVPSDALHYYPVARPGRRLPHFWVEPEVSSHDLLGLGFTVMSTRSDIIDSALWSFGNRNVPITAVELDAEYADTLGSAAVVVRPDGYIGWRGDSSIDMAVVDRLRGADRTTGADVDTAVSDVHAVGQL